MMSEYVQIIFCEVRMVIDKINTSSNPTIFELRDNETSRKSIINKWNKVLL